MEKIIIDTSVLVKWFVQEEDSDKAWQLLVDHQHKKIQIILPEIALLELINALYWGADFSEKEILEALKALKDLKIIYKNINFTQLEQTTKLIKKGKIQSYDALFIVLAEEENCFLITVDKKHHKKNLSKRIRYLS